MQKHSNNFFVLATEGMKCVRSVEISEQTKISTLQTLSNLFQFYVFQDISRDSPPSSPFLHVGIGVHEELNHIRRKTIKDGNINAFDFYSMISDEIFRPLKDAHTQLTKPKCFQGSLIQPFALKAEKKSNEVQVFVNGIYGVASNVSQWDSPSFFKQIGKRVTHVNGVPIIQAVKQFSSEYSYFSKDPSVNFNAYLMGGWFAIRPLMYGWSHTGGEESIEWSFSDGQKMKIPWILWFSGNLSDCNPSSSSSQKNSISSFSIRNANRIEKSTIWPHVRDSILFSDPSSSSFSSSPSSSFQFRTSLLSSSLYKPSLASIPTVKDIYGMIKGDVHILRIPSFRENAVKDGMEQLRQLEAKEKLILDLRSNGGGYVCEGLFLISALTSSPPPLLYDMRHSEGLDILVQEAKRQEGPGSNLFGPNIWSLPNSNNKTYSEWYGPRELHRGGITSDYSNLVEYSIKNCAQPPKSPFVYEKILILTDGNCGSTCAIATSLLSINHQQVKTIVVGGLDDQEEMSFSTFPGGIKVNDQEIFSWFSKSKNHLLSHLPFSPKSWMTDIKVSVTFAEIYLDQNQSIPEEFTFLPSTYRLLSWPSLDAHSSSLLYDQVIPYFNGTPTDSWLKVGSIQFWVGVSLLGLLFIILFVFATFLLLRKRHQEYIPEVDISLTNNSQQ